MQHKRAHHTQQPVRGMLIPTLQCRHSLGQPAQQDDANTLPSVARLQTGPASRSCAQAPQATHPTFFGGPFFANLHQVLQQVFANSAPSLQQVLAPSKNVLQQVCNKFCNKFATSLGKVLQQVETDKNNKFATRFANSSCVGLFGVGMRYM